MQETVEIVTKPEIDLQYYLNAIINYLISHYPDFLKATESVLGFLVALSIPVSVLLFIGIIYSVERLKAIRRKESEIYDKKIEIAYEETAQGNPEIAKRWDRVTTFIESNTQIIFTSSGLRDNPRAG